MFKKREPKIDDTIIKRQEAFDELKAFRDVGETFNFRGVECIVEDLIEVIPMVGIVPRIAAAYKDNNGKIHYIYFYVRHLPVLYAENK